MNLLDEIREYSKRVIPDERGYVCHMLRRDEYPFCEFGEIYFSAVYPGQVKAWHFHKEMDLNYYCVSGMVKVVALYDPTKEYEEFFIGERNPSLLHIPHGLWNGFTCVGDRTSIVANCATIPYSEEDILRLPSNEFDDWYRW